MSGKIVIITHQGRTSEEPYTGEEPALSVLQGHVGGWIEQVPGMVNYEGQLCVAFVNEEGAINDMPHNLYASRLVRHNHRLFGNMVIVVPSLESTTSRPTMTSLKDGCERCKGQRGGVPGNENVMPDGTLLCDYCHADDLRKELQI